MIAFVKRLTDVPHASDKQFYLESYARHFEPLADAPITLLELGVDRGASLRLWRDFFLHGTIVGLDENPVKMPDFGERIRLYQGRQEDTSLLDRIGKECAPGGFDIIIDDCAHIAELARTSFWFLFEHHLKPGGIYAIEDWGTGYWRDWPDGKAFEPNHSHGMVGFVKELVDECGIGGRTHPEHGMPPRTVTRFLRVEIQPGLVIVIKRPQADQPGS